MILLVAALLFAQCSNLYAQENQPTTEDKVWTDEEWKKAVEGIEYIENAKEEKKEEDSNDFKIPENASSWDGEWLKSPTTKVVVIIITLALLIFTLIKLLGKTGNANAKVYTDNINIEELTEENFIETDLEKLLRLALESNDYRSAVRILYLSTIQQLNTTGLILWKKDKTNKDFLREMRKHSEYKTFRDITLAYEIVWYGDRQIELQQFTSLKNIVDNFSQKINIEPKTK
jgi:hypothetical protein